MSDRTAARWRFSLFSRFTPPLEQQFQESYFLRIVPTMRFVAPVMILVLCLGLLLAVRTPAPYDLPIALPQIAFWIAVFVLSWLRSFWRVWQPVLALLALIMAAVVLSQSAPVMVSQVTGTPFIPRAGIGSVAPPTVNEAPTIAQQKFYFVLLFVVLLIPLAVIRLHFFWSAVLYGGVALIGSYTFLRYFPPGPGIYLDLHYLVLPAMLVIFTLLLMSLIQEQVGRMVFWANHQLEEERNDERRKLLETESKLHVLAQAIGGIVHDIGNPLTTVQMGSETLQLFLKDEAPDKEQLCEFALSISDGAQMLNFLRLSLIEQTRVLEDKPTPLNLKPTKLRSILECGIRFQKPHMVGNRKIQLQNGDALLCVDEMKMVTVWMNLVGNALKYSDGDIAVRWCEFQSEEGNNLLVAVADQGLNGQGISCENAAKLFSAFVRLEAHSQIEGTGLGLLSVQKIVEAHGGKVWIEGFQNGTPESAHFSTAQGIYPPMLQENERTAFVVLCPLVQNSG